MTAVDTNPIDLSAVRQIPAAAFIAEARRQNAPARLYTWRAKGSRSGGVHGDNHYTQADAMDVARGDWEHIEYGPTAVGPDKFVMRVRTSRLVRHRPGVVEDIVKDVEYRGRPVEIDHDAVIGEFHRRLAQGDQLTEDAMQLIVDVLNAHTFGNENDLLDALDDLMAVLAR